MEKFKKAKLPLFTIEELTEKAEKICGKPQPIRVSKDIVGVVEYRDGTIIDVIHKVIV